MAPKVGVKLNAPIVDVRWSDIRDMALVADDAGFDSLWSEDHQFGPCTYRTASATMVGGDPPAAVEQLARAVELL